MRVLLGSAFVTHADHADPWVDARQMTLTTTRSSDTQTHTPEWAYTSLEATSPLPVGVMAGGQGGAKKLAFESVGPPAFDTLLVCVCTSRHTAFDLTEKKSFMPPNMGTVAFSRLTSM